MIVCPSCGFENIDGSDSCEKCQTALTFLSKPQPGSWIERSILKDRIEALIPRRPLVVAPDAKVSDVLKCLVDNHIGCVIVADGEKLVGIFSERDALMRLNTEFAELGDRPISEFMTSSPETVTLEDRIAFALHKMDLGGYRHIPVLKEGRITGVISIRDILRYISEDLLAPGTV